jgi:hypothetical protein
MGIISNRELEREVLRGTLINAKKVSTVPSKTGKRPKPSRSSNRNVSWERVQRVLKYWGVDNPTFG